MRLFASSSASDTVGRFSRALGSLTFLPFAFALMKSNAVFINTARGRLVDEPALIRALQDGTIAGAGLDVYWDEPPVTHDPHVPVALRKLDNVVLAPHNGGATWDSRGAQTSAIARSIVTAIKASGEESVTTEAGEARPA